MSISETTAPDVDRPELRLATTLKDNTVFVIAGKIALEAVENKILILIDKFKSGYECKDCNETGKFINCECQRTSGELGINSKGFTCKFRDKCSTQRVGETCKTCNGTGSTLIMPANARGIPTSGVIVSVGPLATKRRINERVLFGAHTGYFLPFKGNAKIRCMREDEILCLLHAVDNQETLGEFIQIDEIHQD